MGYMKTNYITFDIVDFLQKSTVENNQFRQLWLDCEWENAINIKCKEKDKQKFIDFLIKRYKMDLLEQLSI